MIVRSPYEAWHAGRRAGRDREAVPPVGAAVIVSCMSIADY